MRRTLSFITRGSLRARPMLLPPNLLLSFPRPCLLSFRSKGSLHKATFPTFPSRFFRDGLWSTSPFFFPRYAIPRGRRAALCVLLSSFRSNGECSSMLYPNLRFRLWGPIYCKPTVRFLSYHWSFFSSLYSSPLLLGDIPSVTRGLCFHRL